MCYNACFLVLTGSVTYAPPCGSSPSPVQQDGRGGGGGGGGGGGDILWAQLQTVAGGRDHAGWTPLHAAWRMGVVLTAEAVIALLGPAPPHGARRDARRRKQEKQEKQGKQGRGGDTTAEEENGEDMGEEKGTGTSGAGAIGATEEDAVAGAVDLVDQMLGSVGMFTHETKASKQQVRRALFGLHQPAV